MFPDYGDPYPVWRGGDGCFQLVETLTPALRDSLRQWNRDWEAATSDATLTDRESRGWAWLAEGDRLGAQLAAETGAVVVVLGPERYGSDCDCPHCGREALGADDEDK